MLYTYGSEPYRSIKEKSRIMDMLKRQYTYIKFSFTDDLVLYEYKVKKENIF